MSSIFNSEKRFQKIDVSKLRINGSDMRFKTLDEYVNWPFGQKDPDILTAYYRQKRAETRNAMIDAPDAPF